MTNLRNAVAFGAIVGGAGLALYAAAPASELLSESVASEAVPAASELASEAGMAELAERDELRLDFESYRRDVEPIFIRPRGGYVAGQSACVNCHTWQATTPLKLEPLQQEGSRVFWTEEQSRSNYEVVMRLVRAGDPDNSRLLRKPLAQEAGGVGEHTGGVFWESKDDPEWQVMAEWVRSMPTYTGATETAPELDFEFFRSCVQPIFVNPIEKAVACTECHSGTGERSFANRYPEGRDSWTEEESRQSFAALSQLIEPGYPEYSRFLHHPLHPDAGGDFMHNGGRRWMSKEDPEWQALAAWVRGEARGSTCPAALQF
jgi:hypothetical protein